MLGLDSGDGCCNHRCQYTHYGLFEGGVHNLRISYDFVEMGNCSKKLVCICESKGVVKTRGSKCCFSSFFSGDVEKREIYRLSSSYAINEPLQGEIDAKSLFIACVALKFVDDTGKALGFY